MVQQTPTINCPQKSPYLLPHNLNRMNRTIVCGNSFSSIDRTECVNIFSFPVNVSCFIKMVCVTNIDSQDMTNANVDGKWE